MIPIPIIGSTTILFIVRPGLRVFGQTVLLLVPPDRWEEVADFLRRINQGETIRHFDTVRVSKGGQPIDMSPNGEQQDEPAKAAAMEWRGKKRAQKERAGVGAVS